jgi:hypothetical protein
MQEGPVSEEEHSRPQGSLPGNLPMVQLGIGSKLNRMRITEKRKEKIQTTQ